jgi:phosphoribosyl-dephospho-CoA transferase
MIITGTPAPTHDLLRLREPSALSADTPVPAWVGAALRPTPWVVVRRGRIQAGRIPVGVRGDSRSQRFAAWVRTADIAERRSPEELLRSWDNRPSGDERWRARQEEVPALAALGRVGPVLSRFGYGWGPGGSVGFELATTVATATAMSDLDIVIRAATRLEPDRARHLHDALLNAAATMRIDVLLETPLGGVSLADLVGSQKHLLLRTPDGARLTADPWEDDSATEASP